MVNKYNKKKKSKNGQPLLINLLWKKFGGPSAVARALKMPWYAPGTWNRDGQVPTKFLSLVAGTFDVPIWGLNYKAAKYVNYAEHIPSWDEVVKMYGFEKDQEKELIKLGPP